MIHVHVEVERNIKNVVVDRSVFMLELDKYNGVTDKYRNNLKEVGVSL